MFKHFRKHAPVKKAKAPAIMPDMGPLGEDWKAWKVSK
jgi:hypothetical protein